MLLAIETLAASHGNFLAFSAFAHLCTKLGQALWKDGKTPGDSSQTPENHIGNAAVFPGCSSHRLSYPHKCAGRSAPDAISAGSMGCHYIQKLQSF